MAELTAKQQILLMNMANKEGLTVADFLGSYTKTEIATMLRNASKNVLKFDQPKDPTLGLTKKEQIEAQKMLDRSSRVGNRDKKAYGGMATKKNFGNTDYRHGGMVTKRGPAFKRTGSK